MGKCSNMGFSLLEIQLVSFNLQRRNVNMLPLYPNLKQDRQG